MYKVGIVLFDDFTDVDFSLMYDLLGRSPDSWSVKVLGTKPEHRSSLGLPVKTNGHVAEVAEQDVVLFTSGKAGIPAALRDAEFMGALTLDPDRQLIGSICAGSFILHQLGLLQGRPLTTNPDARDSLVAMGGDVQDLPLVVQGNIATAGGCLSLLYLIGWVAERLYGPEKRRLIHRQLIPAGQRAIFESLIDDTLASALDQSRVAV